MKSLLIGSRALDYWHNVGLVKPHTDWDVISNYELEGTEWHSPYLLNNGEFERFTTQNDYIDFTYGKRTDRLYVVTLEGLAIIKRSHLHRDLGFSKHITMYHKYLKPYLNNLYSWQEKILQDRIALTMKEFPQLNPNLNQSVEGFFDDAVDKVFNHDWLHELYAHEDKPLYSKMQTNPAKAWCSKELWDNFSHTQKVQCVQEECYVIATERFLVPSNYQHYTKLAYNKALNKVCTTLCSGWFRDFAIENYPEILQSYDENKVKTVVQLLKDTSGVSH